MLVKLSLSCLCVESATGMNDRLYKMSNLELQEKYKKKVVATFLILYIIICFSTVKVLFEMLSPILISFLCNYSCIIKIKSCIINDKAKNILIINVKKASKIKVRFPFCNKICVACMRK